jgi:putative ABC transport system permease protein
MSLLQIVLIFLRQRRIASVLTGLSVAVGVALVAAILALRVETERSFSQKDTGFEVVVGAKGSPLQLVLNTMYHLGTPVGNIPVAVFEQVQRDRRVKSALPMVFGDNVGGYKVIGTTTDFFTTFEYRKGQTVQIAQGKPFSKHHQIVLGSHVAAALKLKVGDSVLVTHGVQEDVPGAHEHGTIGIVGILAPTGTALDKGVYCTMYTVWDTHYHEFIEAQEAAEAAQRPGQSDSQANSHDAEKDAEKHKDGNDSKNDKEHEENTKRTHTHEQAHNDDGEHTHEIPAEFTTITAIAVKLRSPVFFDSFIRSINEGTQAQATMPIREIMSLFEIVGSINGVLLGISYVVIIVGAISIVVALYNSMNERRREIAIMRSLGARRRTILALVLAEAVIVGASGAVLGIILARIALTIGRDYLARQIGGNVQFALLYGFDGWLILAVAALTAAVALLPAFNAYRTDVARNLAPIA